MRKTRRLDPPELGRYGVQRACRDLLEVHGWVVYTTHERHAFLSTGRKGQVDLVAVKRNDLPSLFIECKRRGEKPEPHQLAHHEDLKARGFEVLVIDEVNDLAAYIAEIEGDAHARGDAAAYPQEN